MQRTDIAMLALTVGLLAPACQGTAAGPSPPDEPRAGYAMMGKQPPVSPTPTFSLGADTYPCRAARGNESYEGYGPGRMRRGGLAPEVLEPDHIVIAGEGVNLHGSRRVTDGASVEMEMDEDYFGPTILKGSPGATITIELQNEGSRPHNFSVPQQAIDLNCGVRATGEVRVTFPRSGVLMFFCKYGATSGMRGALSVGE